MPVYQNIGWYLASSNSLNTQQYQYLYHPQTMIPADPYHQISPSLRSQVKWEDLEDIKQKVGSTEVVDSWILNKIGGVEERVAGTITMPLQGRGYLMIWICWYHSLGVV